MEGEAVGSKHFESLFNLSIKKIYINYIKSDYAATVFTHSYHFFQCSFTMKIWWGTFSLLFFFKVSNSSYSTKRHCSYSSYSFFVFRFYFFFYYIYCYTDTTNFTIFSQLLTCQYLISQNKIIKYEIVTNHNWK